MNITAKHLHALPFWDHLNHDEKELLYGNPCLTEQICFKVNVFINMHLVGILFSAGVNSLKQFPSRWDTNADDTVCIYRTVHIRHAHGSSLTGTRISERH